MKMFRVRTILFGIGIGFFVVFFSTNILFAAQTEAERAALEKQLRELEGQIVEHEATIGTLKNEGKSLSAEVGRLEATIGKINLQIKAVNLQISKLDNEIGEKETEIEVTQGHIVSNRETLTRALQKLYVNNKSSLFEVMLKNPQLSDFIGEYNSLLNVQDSLIVTIDRITDLKDELIDQREVLALKRDDAAALKRYQDAQRANVELTKKEKANLLTVTRGEEARFQKILTETKKSAAEIRSRIFQLLGGGELTFEAAYQFAKLAEGATGIRAAMILAVLDRESALGRNVGQCDYQGAMHPTRDIPHFLTITAELGLNPTAMKVSCANNDGAYGGAMGPAQFIPSTWQIYKSRISAVTGNNPPSPWRHADAFTATGLYLSDAYNSTACVEYARDYKHLVDTLTLQTRCAAAKYYAGSRWFTYRFAYGDPVVERAERFQRDIDILNS